MEFKQRWYKHRSDFLHKENKDSTRLSSYIWNLKDNNIKFEINWNMVKKHGPQTRGGPGVPDPPSNFEGGSKYPWTPPQLRVKILENP